MLVCVVCVATGGGNTCSRVPPLLPPGLKSAKVVLVSYGGVCVVIGSPLKQGLRFLFLFL